MAKSTSCLEATHGLGAAFDRKVLDVMNLMGVSLGKFSICVGFRKVMNTHRTCRDECLSLSYFSAVLEGTSGIFSLILVAWTSGP